MTVTLSPTDRLRLRRGARIATDPLSGAPVLLFPEGVLFLNETAAAVVRHCDGNHSVAEAIQAIAEVYDGVDVTDITVLLQDLIAQRLLVAGRG